MAMEEWCGHLGAGLIFCAFGRYEESLNSLVHCHQVALESGDECREAVAARCLGDALAMGEIINLTPVGDEEAFFSLFPHFENSSSGSVAAQAWSAFFVGAILFESGRDDHASRWLSHALSLAAVSSEDLWLIRFRSNAHLFELHEKWEFKVHYYRMQKQAAASKLPELVYSLSNFGDACIKNHEFDDAIRARDELMGCTGSSEDELLRAISDKLCGTVAYTLKQYQESLFYNKRVLSLLKVPRPASWSSYFGYCATAGLKSCSATPARDMWSNSLIATALLQIAEAHSNLMELELALAAAGKYKQHLTLSRMNTANLSELHYLECLCKVYSFFLLRDGDWEKLSDHVEDSLAQTLQLAARLRDVRTYISTLLCMVNFAAQCERGGYHFYLSEAEDAGYFEMINSFFEEAETLARLYDPDGLLDVLHQRALLLFRMQKLELLIEKLEELGALFLEAYYKFGSFSRGRILFSEKLKQSFQMLQVALVCSRQPDRALVWAERERARDLLHSIRINESTGKAFKEELMEFDLDDEKALEEIILIARDAGEETVFLVYTSFLESCGLCGFLVHRRIRCGCFVKFEQSTSILALVQQTVESFRKKRSNTTLLQHWYKLLISPIEEDLQKINPRKLVIIPGEASDFSSSRFSSDTCFCMQHLSSLPFAALHKEDGEPFLVQRFAISYAPSLRMYAKCKDRGEALMRSTKRSSALVVGNPATALARVLPHAEDEAEATEGSLKRAGFQHIKVLQSDQATKSAVLESLPSSDWVHYAGHAVVSSEFPHGALLLAGDSGEESACKASASISHVEPEADRGCERGMRLLTHLLHRSPSEVLTGDDIETSGVRIQALVTVLSACQSGLGEVFAEGVLGMYRSLHVAGAPSVLCSLWSVDDECSKTLMEKLYERLLAGAELAIALQEVVVESIDDAFDDNSLIHNWAAFIISGNPEMKLELVR